jgi:hypothetical protein
MLPHFCLRVGLGLIAALLLLAPGRAFTPKPLVGPRFFRTQFLIVLGVVGLALLFVRYTGPWYVVAVVAGAAMFSFAGSVVWALEGGPGGRSLIVLTMASLAIGLGLLEVQQPHGGALTLLSGLASAAVLGSALSAMLLGHSYLVAPSMSITPLFRLLTAVFMALIVRLLVEGVALGWWTGWSFSDRLTADQTLWLPVRWGVGFIAPLGLCWMAWQTARIRSTQSATGILYVVVIFCCLGELFSAVSQPWSN